MKGRDAGLERFRTKGIQERRDTGKEGKRKRGFRTEVCGTGEMLEIFMRGGMHAHLVLKWR